MVSSKHAVVPVIHPERGNAAEEHHERHEGKHQRVRRDLAFESPPEGFLVLRPALHRAIPLVVCRATSVDYAFRHGLLGIRSRRGEQSAERA